VDRYREPAIEEGRYCCKSRCRIYDCEMTITVCKEACGYEMALERHWEISVWAVEMDHKVGLAVIEA
jgi:hypothetical protein